MKNFYKPEEGDAIENCFVPGYEPAELVACSKCAQVAYRIIVIGRLSGEKRRIPLCARHFISACIKYPELERVTRQGKSD